MVTRNDHGLGLYNGDIGICMLEADATIAFFNLKINSARLKVYFELPDGSVKAVFYRAECLIMKPLMR